MAKIDGSSVGKSDLGNATVEEYTLLEKQGRGCTHRHDFKICLNSNAPRHWHWPTLDWRVQSTTSLTPWIDLGQQGMRRAQKAEWAQSERSIKLNWLSFYACGIQIRCIERHTFWLAKPSGVSHIWNSIHSPLYCMFRSSRVHYGQNSFKYLQNISPIIPWLSFAISIILEGHFVFWVMHFMLLSHTGLLF